MKSDNNVDHFSNARLRQFKTKDLDLIAYLRFKGFKALDNPIEDSSGIRWVVFEKTRNLNKEVLSFVSGNSETKLLNELRKTRSFLLDSRPVKEGEADKNDSMGER